MLNQLLNKIGVTIPPQEVRVVPETYASINDCYPNVLEKVKRDGGEIIYGWLIHRGDIVIEAERHAVWKSASNELIDITPNVLKSKYVDFYIDNTWEYKGKSHDNVRLNITGNPIGDDFILVCEAISSLAQLSRTDDKGGRIIFSNIKNAIDFLEVEKHNRGVFILRNGLPESYCYCGSSEKYQNCHGFNLEENMKEIIERATLFFENNL